MSEKMTCPGCESHTSSVLRAARDGDPCPYCGAELPTSGVARAEGFEPTRWWRVVDPENNIWAETASEQEARERTRPGDTLLRLYERTETTWVRE